MQKAGKLADSNLNTNIVLSKKSKSTDRSGIFLLDFHFLKCQVVSYGVYYYYYCYCLLAILIWVQFPSPSLWLGAVVAHAAAERSRQTLERAGFQLQGISQEMENTVRPLSHEAEWVI